MAKNYLEAPLYYYEDNKIKWGGCGFSTTKLYPLVFHEYLYLLLCCFDDCYIIVIIMDICRL